MTTGQKYVDGPDSGPTSAPAVQTPPQAAQTPPFAGFALHTIDGLELLTPDELRLAVRTHLPADLPAGMAPTLQPNDVVILTPLSLMDDPVGAVVYLVLRELDTYAVGRLVGRKGHEWVLTDNLPNAETWVGVNQIVSAWAVRLLVGRKVS